VRIGNHRPHLIKDTRAGLRRTQAPSAAILGRRRHRERVRIGRDRRLRDKRPVVWGARPAPTAQIPTHAPAARSVANPARPNGANPHTRNSAGCRCRARARSRPNRRS
jgi:hypothetical protein